MINPSALNVLVIGASAILFVLAWRMSASWLVERNPDSPIAQAMAVIL